MSDEGPIKDEERGSSPASRGGAGTFIEGELGAFYLLSMLADIPAHGLPGAKIVKVRFQGTDFGYKLDDLILHGASSSGASLLEIQSKRDITFAPRDPVYADVAGQIAKSASDEVDEARHFLGIATQRTSRKISGAYQDVLKWAAAAENSEQFFARLNAKGVANPDMREFVETSSGHFVAAGVANEDDAVWRILRRLLILEFDFESSAPLARTHALMLAQHVLADEDAGRADALWHSLISIAIETGTTGGSLDRDGLRQKLVEGGWRLRGDRDHALARTKLADMAKMTLEDIGNSVAGVNLPRHEAVAELDDAMETQRFVEVRGGPGVGKSWVLRNAAERVARQGPIIVLDPIATPGGGWLAFSQALGIVSSAKEFLGDLAASGGATIFVDSLDMFTDPGRQRTVSELLRAASAIPGFSVIATGRTISNADPEPWLADDILAAFGGTRVVRVSELTEAEVAILVDQAPGLARLLDAHHPAAGLARNLYRLSRLLKVPSATEIRTEAALAQLWWTSADGAVTDDVRPAQRILADLAARSLKAETGLELSSDSSARTHLLDALTLKEVRRDRLAFYHDVLRDWAIGNFIVEDPARLDALDLTVRVSPIAARGIEFAGRLMLETKPDCAAWIDLLHRLSPKGAHSSWRRQAMLAMVRSEAGFELLGKYSTALLNDSGALLVDLITTIAAVETVATTDIMRKPDGSKVDLPRSFRTNTTGSAIWVLRWVLDHVDQIPMPAIAAVVELIEILLHLLKEIPTFAKPAAEMLFSWLRQLDLRESTVTIPLDKTTGRGDSDARRRMIEKLRTMALVFGGHAPEQLKAYLTEIAAEGDSYKIKEIRPFSQAIAPVAPVEFAALILGSLVDRRDRRRASSSPMDRTFTFADSDYMPPSPAQPPFFDLLEAAPAEGLKLIRLLVAEAVAHNFEEKQRSADGFTLVFDDGPRFFPWTDTYLWSRDQAREYSAASGLKALEAWSHKRVDEGEPVETVLADILGPDGSCAAYLLVAVDVLLSHLDKTREALVPFIASADLLAEDKQRVVSDQMSGMDRLFGEKEPAGTVRLADLKARDSRRMTLHSILTAYLGDDNAGNALRARLAPEVEKLEPFESWSTWVDARFIGRHAANVLNLKNWKEIEGGQLTYQSPPDEAAHLAQMEERHGRSVHHSETEARISLALEKDDYATAETARIAVEYANGDLPDDSDTDVLKSRATRLMMTALLVARDGDAALLDEHEGWVRKAIALGLAEKSDRYGGSNDTIRYSRPGIASLALIHLWLRRRTKEDRDALVQLATRDDRSAAPAFSAALGKILDVDVRLLKAAVRAAFSNCVWRWHAYDEDETEQQSFEAAQSVIVEAAVAAEINWLDGGEEPAWPAWPKERPSLRRSVRIRVPGPITAAEFDVDETEEEEAEETSNDHVDSRAAAQWLGMVNAAPKDPVDWGQEIVDCYSGWTAKMNGLGLPADAEIAREPDEWNHQYYVLLARRVMEASADRFEAELDVVTGLPDESFGEVAETFIQASDALYFNDPARPADRPVEIRARLADRVIALRRWKYADDPAKPNVDRAVAGVVAKMLLNTHSPFSGTTSYLPRILSDRLDPLLEPIRSLLPGGPMSFVAMCTMNLLMVVPRPRHLGFLLEAAEAWFERTRAVGFWIASGIGRRIVRWFDAVILEDVTLLAPAHPERVRIDRILGDLVSVGVAEAHELELKIEAAVGAAQG